MKDDYAHIICMSHFTHALVDKLTEDIAMALQQEATPMKQITIVTPARAGLMADISDQLGEAGINIETLEAFVVRDWDIVQLTVSDYNQALVVLRDAGFNAITEDAVVVNVKDQPGRWPRSRGGCTKAACTFAASGCCTGRPARRWWPSRWTAPKRACG